MTPHDHPPYGDLAQHIWHDHGYSGSLSVYSQKLQETHESMHRVEDGIRTRRTWEKIPSADRPAPFLEKK